MADPQPISAKITAIHDNGFKVEGFDNYFNLSNSYQGIPIPPVGTEIEFAYKPWQNKAGRTIYYVDEIISVTQVAAPPVGPPPVAQTTTHPQSVAGPHVPGNMAPTPTPAAQPPRIEPEPVSQDTTPVLGTQAYRDISIPKQVALKEAVRALIGVYGGDAVNAKSPEELSGLAQNIVGLAGALYGGFLDRTIAPDDSLVPTPSESRTAYRGDGGYVDDASADPEPDYRG